MGIKVKCLARLGCFVCVTWCSMGIVVFFMVSMVALLSLGERVSWVVDIVSYFLIDFLFVIKFCLVFRFFS